MRPTNVRTATAAFVAVSGLLVAPGTAQASCAKPLDPPSLADHDHVFAGSVDRTTNGFVAAEVSVLDVWHGPDLPPDVVVIGGELRRGVDSSVDRKYRAGERYAFFVKQGEDGALRDSACTPTAPLASLTNVDPPGVRPPDPSAAAPADPRGALARAGVLGITAALALTGAGIATAIAVGAPVAARRGHRRRSASDRRPPPAHPGAAMGR